MDLVLNNLQKLICHKTHQTKLIVKLYAILFWAYIDNSSLLTGISVSKAHNYLFIFDIIFLWFFSREPEIVFILFDLFFLHCL